MATQAGKPLAGCVVVVLICGFVIWLIWSRIQHQQREQAESARKTQVQQQENSAAAAHRVEVALQTLAARTNGVREWERRANANAMIYYEMIYTVDVQDTMIRRDHRPIVFKAYIQDMRHAKEAYLLFLSLFLVNLFFDLPSFRPSPDIYYWLTCDMTKGEWLRVYLSDKKHQDASFAIAAVISSLERPWFEMQGSVIRLTTGRTIMAYGDLVDIRPIEDQ